MKKILLTFILIISLLCSCKKEDNNKLLFIELENINNIEIYQNSSYNYENVKVIAYYKDYKEDVTKKASFSSVDTSILGKQTVTVKYLECSSKYDINIVLNNNYEFSLKIEKEPNKLNYYINEKINLDGLIIAVYKNGNYDTFIDINSISYDILFYNKYVSKLDNIGPYQIVLKYTYRNVELTTSFYISVIDNPNNLNQYLKVDTSNAKLKYDLKESFDYTGLKIYECDSTGVEQLIPNYLCEFKFNLNYIEKTEFDTAGTYSVIVSFNDIKGYFEIVVGNTITDKKIQIDISYAKQLYYVGEEYTYSGLDIKYYENNELKEIVPAYKCQIDFYLNGVLYESFSTAGLFRISIMYNDCYAEYYVTVKRR